MGPRNPGPRPANRGPAGSAWASLVAGRGKSLALSHTQRGRQRGAPSLPLPHPGRRRQAAAGSSSDARLRSRPGALRPVARGGPGRAHSSHRVSRRPVLEPRPGEMHGLLRVPAPEQERLLFHVWRPSAPRYFQYVAFSGSVTGGCSPSWHYWRHNNLCPLPAAGKIHHPN